MARNVDVKIDGISYKVENVQYKKIKGRELNSLKFEINDSDKLQPFIRGDVIEITITDEFDNIIPDTFYLQNDKTETYSFVTKTVSHEIQGIERTYKLQAYANITRQYLDNGIRTLWDIVEELRLTVPIVQNSDLATTRLFILNSNLDVLKNFIAPDITFNNLNLRECLIDIFDIVGAYPILKQNITNDELDIVFYNERLNKVNIDDNTVYKIQESTLNEYASIYDIDASNLVNTASTIGGAIFDPVENQFKGLRSDEGFFTSSNAYLESELAKFKKTRIQMRVPTTTQGILIIDITENIVETSLYKTLIDDDIFPANVIYLYKSNALVWDFKQQRINGFFRQTGIFNQDTVIERIIKSGLTRYFISQGDDPITASDKSITEYVQQEYYQLEFNLLYTPEYNARMQVERLDTDDVDKIVSKNINQSANFIAPSKLLLSMFNKLEQKSNTKILTAVTTKDLSTIYSLNYYTADNYVLTEVLLLVNNYDYTINYTWTKNDNKESDRIEIPSQLELYLIPDGERQQKRNEIFKEYIYASTTTLPTEDITALNDFGRDIILNTIEQNPTIANDKAPLGVALFSSEIKLYEDPSTGIADTLSGTQRIIKPLQSWGGKNSLNLYYEFDNALIAGDERVEINNKQTLRGFRYTDENGELINLSLEYCHSYNVNKDIYPLINTPLSNISAQITDLVWYLNTSEIEALTYSIHILPLDSNVIILGSIFFERNFFVEWRDGGFPTLFASQCSSRYEKYETKAKDVIGSAGNWSITNGVLTLESSNSAESWIISDIDGNIYIAVNQKQIDGSFVTATTVNFGKYKNRIGMEVL